jgi:hypothetical protein
MALSEAELKALDFLIAAKKEGLTPAGFININDVVDVAKAVVVTAAAVNAVTAVTGATLQAKNIDPKLMAAGGDKSIDKLMAVRQMALE